MFHSTQKSPVAYYFIYPCMRTCVDLKQHFIQYYCPCTCVCVARSEFSTKNLQSNH